MPGHAQQREWEQASDAAARLIDRGEYDAAARKLREAVVAAAPFGLDDSRVAKSWTDLGWVESMLGRYLAAQHASEQAMRIYERTGKRDANYARAIGSLAAVYANQQQYGKARELAQRAVEIQSAALPADHPELAKGHHLLAFVNLRQERYEEAELHERQALAIMKRHPEGREPQIAVAANSLAMILVGLKRYAEAEALVEESLEVSEKRIGGEDLVTGALLASLGALRLRRHQDAEAERLLARSLKIYERTLGGEHPEIVSVSLVYAQALRRLDRRAEAREYERRARAIQMSRGVEDAPQVVDAQALARRGDR